MIPGIGLSQHVGELRLIVDPKRRRRGIGRMLARGALACGISRLGLHKLVVEVVAEQEPAIGMLQSLGFTPEAVLRDHLLDRSGGMQDVVLLSHFVEDNQAGLIALGIDRELA